jgi:hypothetical protein
VEQQGLITFIKESGLSTTEVAGCIEIAIHPGAARWQYEFGKSLIPPELVPKLPSQIRRLHGWYMDAPSRGQVMLGVKISNEDYFCGDDVIWLYFKELYQLYHQYTLNISFISCWLL